ncbi:GmrSD restriction endonuclease domain-containing protein [Amycolatopsis taiwanensis]|uniref:GmrSD restriction endonuclease domain-containing protein n=1 Tax=Amycolatopsis taiwanensis TaxID=342230 RepID=UPI001FE0990D|nr:DUF262 domain-containing protein [Amycolatopsis taiwanensis]
MGEISGSFYVPAYQRGYRWGEVEVRRLLDDVWGSRDRPYYLQPVVVKRYGDEWELVDGQQRLTTLFLIFQYMKAEGLQSSGADYRLRYETREDSAAYLEELDPDRCQENIDFFHIYEAYRCIGAWFDGHGSRRQYVANKFYDALFEQVRVIWYEAADDLDSATLFTRLNVGRIPLTDAELVKALLLSRSRGSVGVTDRALEIAAQWDVIERDLRDPELWAFITGKGAQDPTHISLLLDTIAGGPTGRDRPPFHTFETLRERIAAAPQEFWNEVVDLHSLVLGWFESRDLFHKIGYLVARWTSFSDLIELSRDKPKSRFEAELDRFIRNDLRLSEAALRDLSYFSDKASRALLLMNIETIRQRQHSSERYSFREHALGHWSLEHVHAQNAERLNRAEQWQEWLRLHRRALVALDEIGQAEKEPVLAMVDEVLAKPAITEADFRPLELQLTELLSVGGDLSDGGVDSIANLALLDGDDNSALSNSVFAVKRAAVLDRDRRGSYIPVCTRNVFLKYYSPADEHQMHFWSAQDREHYLDEMVSVLRDYLLPAKEATL